MRGNLRTLGVPYLALTFSCLNSERQVISSLVASDAIPVMCLSHAAMFGVGSPQSPKFLGVDCCTASNYINIQWMARRQQKWGLTSN